MLRSMGVTQRQLERERIASRETSKAIYEAADQLGIQNVYTASSAPLMVHCRWDIQNGKVARRQVLLSKTLEENYVS